MWREEHVGEEEIYNTKLAKGIVFISLWCVNCSCGMYIVLLPMSVGCAMCYCQYL